MLVNKRIDKYFLCIHLYVCAHIVMKEREEEKKRRDDTFQESSN